MTASVPPAPGTEATPPDDTQTGMTHRQRINALVGLLLGMFVAFLSSTIVSNALPTIKGCADVVTKGEAGAGVEEVAAELVESDLVSWQPLIGRSRIAAPT